MSDLSYMQFFCRIFPQTLHNTFIAVVSGKDSHLDTLEWLSNSLTLFADQLPRKDLEQFQVNITFHYNHKNSFYVIVTCEMVI